MPEGHDAPPRRTGNDEAAIIRDRCKENHHGNRNDDPNRTVDRRAGVQRDVLAELKWDARVQPNEIGVQPKSEIARRLERVIA